MIVNGPLDIAGFEHVTSDPVTNLFEGRQIYRTDTKESKVYVNAAWSLFPGEATVNTAGLINPTNSSGFVYGSPWTPMYDGGNSTNVTSASGLTSQFIRVGSVVSFSMRFLLQGSGNGINIEVSFSIPVPSSFSLINNLSATLSNLETGGSGKLNGIGEADVTNNKLLIKLKGDTTDANKFYTLTGHYLIA